MLIGVISDTHGLLRDEAVRELRRVDRILHAGDVGDPAILDRLRELAPVTAVRGNVDRGRWATALPSTEVAEIGSIAIYMLHDIGTLDLRPEAAGFRVVVYGHSHQPKMEQKSGVLYFNPGSAGPRRFDLPITVGRLTIAEGELQAEIIDLKQQLSETRVLSALVDFARVHPDNRTMAASVIGRDPSPFAKYVIINRGSDEGVRRGMPVVTAQGLVGRIDAVTFLSPSSAASLAAAMPDVENWVGASGQRLLFVYGENVDAACVAQEDRVVLDRQPAHCASIRKNCGTRAPDTCWAALWNRKRLSRSR